MPESAASKKILIIDDQEPTRYIFRRILNHGGYQVEEAATGSDGLSKAMLAPDLIIADVNLPDMLGYDLCRRLKSNPLTKSIPVLQISASLISDESRVQALQGGADSYLTQPVEPTVLLASVNALLRLRNAEAQSHLSALHWQTTFDSLSDGLALTDAEGLVLRTNARFAQMLNLVTSEVEGKSLATVVEGRFDLSFAQLRDQLSDGTSGEISHKNRWFRVRYDLIHSDANTVSGSVLVLTDITEQKMLQERLRLSERLAATGRLAHIIAHEINNPLEAMSNLLYLAEQSATTSPATRAYIEQASLELVRISQITKQVLAYHRDSKNPLPTSANEIMASVLAMFRAHIGARGVELDYSLTCSDPIQVHPGEIRQVLTNVISNALDATEPLLGRLKVRCMTAVDQMRNLKGVRFLFSDNGQGIPASNLPYIFHAFYTTKEEKGSGIGLWISAEIVAKHGGRIRLRTRTTGKYRGTLFDIFLPQSTWSDL